MGGVVSTEEGDWSQDAVSQLTPSMSKFAAESVKGRLEPAVQRSLSGSDGEKTARSSSDFQFTSLDFGSIPPKIRNITTQKGEGGVDGQGKSVLLDFDLDYQGDANIQVSFMGIPSGVRDLTLQGRARIILKPTTSSAPPFFGGIQFCFLDDVKIDFDFEGIADVCDWPIVKTKIRRAVAKEVASCCVFPNMFVIPTSSINPMLLRCFYPKGVIGFQVDRCQGLPKKGGIFSLLGQNKPDVYVICKLGTTSYETKVINNSTEPVWEAPDWFDFLLEHPMGHKVQFLVYDHDSLSKDDFLGRAEVNTGDFQDVTEQDGIGIALPLMDDALENRRGDEIAGELLLKMRFLPLKPLNELGSEPRMAVVTIFVYSCNNLIEMADGSPVAGKEEGVPGDVVVQATLGNHPMQETATIKNTQHPNFEHGFTFTLKDMSGWTDQTASLVAVEKAAGSFGRLELNLGELAENPIRRKIFSFSQERPMITITLSASMTFA